ncbi:MAG: cytochrome d ubiquinol oxidase subunit II [Spirochaetes bacterium]|nr:cytochrome d ubiquinol oxidase subunit II [Spirochaetota bacterium]
MDNPNFLQATWYLLIGILFVGYSILDGFDLGVGILFPFISKDDKKRAALIRSIAPVWDGNEVWLLTAGGALFAAFPLAYATVFSGFYLAIMLVLFSLIFRAVSLEFWTYDETRRPFWSKAFFVGSAIPSLLFGVALGNVVYGVPLSENHEFAGNFFTLLRPYPLLIGVLGFSAILLQGSAFVTLKMKGEIREKAQAFVKRLIFLNATLFTASCIAHIHAFSLERTNFIFWICAALFVSALGVGYSAIVKENDIVLFVATSASFALLWGCAGAIHYPRLVAASNGIMPITAVNAASGDSTLRIMLIIALIFMPLVIGYKIFVYRVFKGRIEV